MWPRIRPLELNGDFMRREARAFSLMVLPCFVIGVLLIYVLRQQPVHDKWPLFVFGVPGVMLLAASGLSAIFGWYWMVESLRHERSKVTPSLDRILYLSSVAASLMLSWIGWHFAVNGYLSGRARFRYGVAIRMSESPVAFWLLVSMWLAIGMFFLCCAWKQSLQMMKALDRH